MRYYPALLDMNGQLAVIIGGGPVAARKATALLESGALVRLVAPTLCAQAAALAQSPGVSLLARPFQAADLDGARLVFCAARDQEANRQAAQLARQRGLWVNVVDQPEQGDFIVPAHLRRGDLLVAVATGGASPAVSRRIRQRLERQFGPEWAPLLRLLAAVRRAVLAAGRPDAENRALFYALVDSPLAELLRDGDLAGVERLLAEVLGPGHDLAALGLDPAELTPQPEEAR